MLPVTSSSLNRAMFFLLADALILSFSFLVSMALRFGGLSSNSAMSTILPLAAIFVSLKIMVFAFFRVYRMSWSYFGMYELWEIVKALSLSLFMLAGLSFIMQGAGLFLGVPRSVYLIDYGCSLLLVAGLRMSKRFYLHVIKGANAVTGKRMLVIGAGNAGEQIVRDMKRNRDSGYRPVAFIDDDLRKTGIYIHGVRVCGDRNRIQDVINQHDVEMALIAMPSAPSRDIRDILARLRASGITQVKTIPGLTELMQGKVSLSDIQEIRIEDILGREQAEVDCNMIARYLKGKRVLVTGAGGSIGSEVLRQVLGFKPERVIAFDIDETELFNVEQELKGVNGASRLCPVVGDIRDVAKVRWVFANHLPHVVFHAAAYKHVPVMEEYPEEAIKTNIFGTRTVARMAVEFGAERFVMVSTDKAVRPTNVMGATKRVAEKIVNELNSIGGTPFVSVRFGNVVGSRGSVVPIFQKQIKAGGPVTVTHEEMTRYFMSIPEAVTLILQAGAMGEGGEVFVLDMGEPVKIIEVAREMIRLHGLIPDVDIPIVISGIRPGEKMYEELLTTSENVEATSHAKIFKAKDSLRHDEVLARIPLFDDMVHNPDPDTLRAFLKELVSSYNPANARFAARSRINNAAARSVNEALS
ncbi:MAG: polysaccharide biosynthesis protein [Nitrospirae bacterium]|nr:polysaccharide biosynthesis protein [Nitrospirota bacterium]